MMKKWAKNIVSVVKQGDTYPIESQYKYIASEIDTIESDHPGY